jgi:hypothetical protein
MIQRMHRHDVSGHLLHLQLEPTAFGAGTGSDPVALRPDALHPKIAVAERVPTDDSATG